MIGSETLADDRAPDSLGWLQQARKSSADFISSKSALALVLYLAFAALVSAGVGYQFYRSSFEFLSLAEGGREDHRPAAG